MNPISLSIAPATRVIGRPYYDLPASIGLMRELWQNSAVNGFEVQILEEWQTATPPRDEREKRLAAWTASPKYTADQIAALLGEAGVPILSIHACRDVGICLCSEQDDEINEGRRLIHEALSLAQTAGTPVCVFHLWDTWKESFSWEFLRNTLGDIATRYSGVKAAVENVPTHLYGFTPFDLARQFEWITLDLRWAAMYDDLERFEAVTERIVNIHLQARCVDSRWVLDNSPFEFDEALTVIRDKWGYRGMLTVEPRGLREGDRKSLLAAIESLRTA